MTAIDEIRQLRAELEAAKQKLVTQDRMSKKGVYFKVSEKGAISVFGFGRYPMTYYANQWAGILAYAEELKEFIVANKDKLATKA